MRHWIEALPLLFLLSCVSACLGTGLQQASLNRKGVAEKHILVVHDNWHSAILIKTADLSPKVLPEMRDFPEAIYLEFSWGDREYFPHPDPGVSLALKAAFWSGGSILHVVGVTGSPAVSYPHAEIIPIAVAAGEFQLLVQFVSETFVRAAPESASEARPGLSENARFYPAQGKFSIFRTCNTWVAEALEAAQLPINAAWVITAGSLGRNVRPLSANQ
jgi:uncharacterized protein (TIGR02117 family)